MLWRLAIPALAGLLVYCYCHHMKVPTINNSSVKFSCRFFVDVDVFQISLIFSVIHLHLHLHLFRSINNNNTIKWQKNRTTRHMTDESWRSCDRGPNHSTPVLSAFSCNLLAAHQSLTSETHRSIIQFLKPSHQGRLSVTAADDVEAHERRRCRFARFNRPLADGIDMGEHRSY